MRHSSDGCAPQYNYSDQSFTTTRRSLVYLDDEVLRLKDTIKERDNEIVKLRSEIHKLKVTRALCRLIACVKMLFKDFLYMYRVSSSKLHLT